MGVQRTPKEQAKYEARIERLRRINGGLTPEDISYKTASFVAQESRRIAIDFYRSIGEGRLGRMRGGGGSQVLDTLGSTSCFYKERDPSSYIRGNADD